FPAADTLDTHERILERFTVSEHDTQTTAVDLHRRHLLFLLKALSQAGDWIRKEKETHPNKTTEEIALGWHEWLGGPTTKNRSDFYKEVTNDSLLPNFTMSENEGLLAGK
ncbi:hypothetical protein H0H87_009516, partial [Tephrocybe sp. NHM501043]